MTHDNTPTHRRLAEIGLRAGGPHGFALAGGHAVAARGILQRPSEDVDLFADWQRRADFPAAVEVVIAETCPVPKLTVRVRFPSPAQSRGPLSAEGADQGDFAYLLGPSPRPHDLWSFSAVAGRASPASTRCRPGGDQSGHLCGLVAGSRPRPGRSGLPGDGERRRSGRRRVRADSSRKQIHAPSLRATLYRRPPRPVPRPAAPAAAG
jgi:hypothetical protein